MDSDERFTHLMESIRRYDANPNEALIAKAFEFSQRLHARQKRLSGEDYFSHPYEVALILAGFRADNASICAALLHDVLEDTKYRLEDLRKEFGNEIANLVDGLTKIASFKESTKADIEAESFRKMLIIMAKDLRIITIKLADRLHNSRTLAFLPPERQKAFAKENLEIYSTLATKLGMGEVKHEMEDLSFKYLLPDEFGKIERFMQDHRTERQEEIAQVTALINRKLNEDKIQGRCVGRAKHYYSIYKKIHHRGVELENQMDLVAFRVITQTVDECYRALRIIHENFKPIAGRLKDYISSPKPNRYQSLHSNVLNGKGEVLEFQIRTEEMHANAVEGLARHWEYKGLQKDKGFDQKLLWMKQLLEWQNEASDAKEFLEGVKIDFFENQIFCFTPKGDVIELPEHSTGLDFAYALHTELGNKVDKIKVNGKIAGFGQELKNGDIVEIIAAGRQMVNSNWLKFVKSSKAKTKIRRVLQLQLQAGPQKRIEKGETVKEILELSRVDKGMKGPYGRVIEVKEGMKELRLGKCCDPLPGEKIMAVMTTKRKIVIHRNDCADLQKLLAEAQSLPPPEPGKEKILPAEWSDVKKGPYRVRINIKAMDRIGLLADMLKEVKDLKLNVLNGSMKTTKDGMVLNLFEIEIKRLSDLDDVKRRILGVPGVTDVYRT